MIQHIRFSVFPPFAEEFDTHTQSDNDNQQSESLHVENEKIKKDGKGEKAKKPKSNPKPSEPKKKATGVPRKSSTQSRSGKENQKEAATTPSQKREFRRSISSDSSLSSRPSSGTRETVAEKILRHH